MTVRVVCLPERTKRMYVYILTWFFQARPDVAMPIIQKKSSRLAHPCYKNGGVVLFKHTHK